MPVSWSIADDSAPGGESSLVEWWLRFDDALLLRLVREALQTNTSVNGAEAALRQSRSLRDVASAALRPKLSGSASVQRSSGSSAATSGERVTANSFQTGLDASWELDIFGANRSALNAAQATVRASAAGLGDVQVSIAAEVALTYIALRNAQARLEIASQNLSSQQETLQITRWRLEAGLITSLEVEQARAAVEQTSALLPALQTGVAQNTHALAVLVGSAPTALSVLLQAAAQIPKAREGIALSIPVETLRKRADVRAAEQQVLAATARVSQAQAARLPQFTLSGSVGLSALSLGALSSGSSVVGALLSSIQAPIFDGGAARFQVNAQQAALDQEVQLYRAAVLTALKDVEDALAALDGDRLRLAHLNDAAQAATNAALMATQRYNSGLVDFQTVLETQRTRLTTQDSVSIALADVGSDHVRLYKALGGGWVADHDFDQASTP